MATERIENDKEISNSNQCICYLDCRIDESQQIDYLNLNMWGKPVYSYALETVRSSGIFKQIIVVTNSVKIKHALHNEKDILVCSDMDFSAKCSIICVFSGRAAMVSNTTLREAYMVFTDGVLLSAVSKEKVDCSNPHMHLSLLNGMHKISINAFAFYQISNGKIKNTPITEFVMNSNEAVVINGANEFELSVILKKKEEYEKLQKKYILERINEKQKTFSYSIKSPSICLIGHSQIDYWSDDEIAGYKVRNCGVAGISSIEYYNYILIKELLNCNADIFVVMHGTNDIILDITKEEIIQGIKGTITYIQKRNKNSIIFFLACIHVNGRMDRDNRKIDEFNNFIKESLEEDVIWIDTNFMNDEFGDLDSRYTIDGLHLSKRGYEILKNNLERYIFRESKK